MADSFHFGNQADFPTIHELVEVWSHGAVEAVEAKLDIINLVKTATNEPWRALLKGETIVRNQDVIEGFEVANDDE